MKNTAIPFHGLFTSVVDWFVERFLVFTHVRFDPLIFLRELSSMLRSEIPLHQALDFSADSFGPTARKRINSVKQHVENGESLSSALDSLPKRWVNPALIATIEAGEKAGRLPDLLDGLSDEFELLASLDRRLRSTLIYPLFVLLIAAICLQGVVPVFASLVEGVGPAMSWGMKALMNYWSIFGPFTTLLLFVLLVFHVVTLNRPTGMARTSVIARFFWWNLPIIRGLRAALIEVRFARTLRLLLDSGIALPEALDLCENVVADNRAGIAIVRSARRIRDGEKPSKVLKGLSFLSPAFIWFIADCEKRGDLLELTETMAHTAEERFATRMEVIEGLLEPAATLALGLFVGSTVVVIYQSLFSIATIVGD